MSTNRNISAKEPLKYLTERIDRADLGEAVVRDRLRSHIVPFTQLNVGGYALIGSVEERHKKIQADYDAFLQARAAEVSAALAALCQGRNWPSEGIGPDSCRGSKPVA